MSCTKPLKGFVVGTTKNGKQELKVVPYKTNHLEYRQGKWHLVYSDYITPNAEKTNFNHIDIPCGKCVGCRLEYAKNWSARCILEMQKYEENCFITLTYDDDNVPYSSNGDWPTLVKKDLQDFWKNLRGKGSKNKIRYFACGEYGDTTFRPHYHAIIFGYKPTDLEFYKRGSKGCDYYTSKSLNDIWKKGYVVVGDATYESACYVARYVMKKVNSKWSKSNYDDVGIEPEFITMSRKPGIASDYYDLHKDTDLFLNEHIIIGSQNGAKQFKPFRYFKKKYEEDYPGDLKKLQDYEKLFSKDFERLKRLSSDKSYIDLLNDEDFILNQKLFKRKEV